MISSPACPIARCSSDASSKPLLRRGAGRRFALFLLDLDRFKEINDTFGHHYGDAILEQFSPRLLAAVRESDTVARLGGDEFGSGSPTWIGPAPCSIAERILAEPEAAHRRGGKSLRYQRQHRHRPVPRARSTTSSRS